MNRGIADSRAEFAGNLFAVNDAIQSRTLLLGVGDFLLPLMFLSLAMLLERVF